MIAVSFFYLFAGVMLASGVMVVISRNPVYSVLFLILAFFNAAGLFILVGAEFLAMLLVPRRMSWSFLPTNLRTI